MIRKVISFALGLVIVLAMGTGAIAREAEPDRTGSCTGNETVAKQLQNAFFQICGNQLDEGLPNVIQRVVSVILGFAGIIAILYLLIGAFRYVASSGNEEQVAQARSTIYNAIIGIVVILITYVVLVTVRNLVIQ